MDSFKQHISKQANGSHGTGTIRRNKWDALIAKEGWVDCQHNCSGTSTKRRSGDGAPIEVEHGAWKHKRPLMQKCGLPENASCEKCLTFDYNPPK